MSFGREIQRAEKKKRTRGNSFELVSNTAVDNRWKVRPNLCCGRANLRTDCVFFFLRQSSINLADLALMHPARARCAGSLYSGPLEEFRNDGWFRVVKHLSVNCFRRFFNQVTSSTAIIALCLDIVLGVKIVLCCSLTPQSRTALHRLYVPHLTWGSVTD